MGNLKQFLAICFFKLNQAELAENTRLSSALLFYSAAAMAIQINFHGAFVAAIAICLEILLTLGFLGILTLSNKLLEDYMPLSCAVFMCTGFMAFLGLPFTLMLYIVKGKLALFLTYSLVALMIWSILVIKYLFEKILLLQPVQSLLIAIGYFFIAYASPFVLLIL
jgi:hypothetical protein